MIRVLFYKAHGTRQDRAVRLLTGSIYSHCELVAPGQAFHPQEFRDGGFVVKTIAASKRDGNAVRVKDLNIKADHWDEIRFPGDRGEAWDLALAEVDKPYDTFGAVLSATMFSRPRAGRWFCSELIAHALGYLEPWEFSPGTLAASGRRLMTQRPVYMEAV